MKHITLFVYTVLLLLSSFAQESSILAADYPAPIGYTQTMTVVVRETDVDNWLPEYRRTFEELTVSSNGNKLGFIVQLAPKLSDKHIYAVNTSGTGLKDLTGSLPGGVVSTSYFRSLRLNAAGTRLFFNHPNEAGDQISFIDTRTKVSYSAVQNLWSTDYRKVFTLNSAGTRLFFKHSGPWNESAKRYMRGTFYADIGGQPIQISDIHDLPCEYPCCDNMNCLRFLGSPSNGSRALFTWGRGGASPNTAMWQAVGGPATRVPNEEHDFVWDDQDLCDTIVSANGKVALYRYMDNATSTNTLSKVNLDTGAKSIIVQLAGNNPITQVALSPTGKVARFDAAGYRTTRIDLVTMAQRDTTSYWFGEFIHSAANRITDITSDDRCYYMATSQATSQDIARIYRVDMAPTDFTKAPRISSISFGDPYLLFQDNATVTVKATVTDAQGRENIQWVRMAVMVDGLEDPVWLSGGKPVVAGSGDLYDDGVSAGDETAADGVYTNDTLSANKWSNFYTKYTIPRYVGIRIVARDKDGNYSIADTVLSVADKALPTVKVTAADSVAAEPGTDRGRFIIKRAGDTTSPLEVYYTVSGTAQNARDYAKLSGKAIIPAGAVSKGVVVTPKDDTIAEGDEAVTITLSPGAQYVVGTPSTATVTIKDNDP